jgi:hypothetical protein
VGSRGMVASPRERLFQSESGTAFGRLRMGSCGWRRALGGVRERVIVEELIHLHGKLIGALLRAYLKDWLPPLWRS